MLGRILFLVLGIYLVLHDHPGWGLFSCLWSFPFITYKHIEDGKDDIHIVIKGEDNE